MNFERTQGLVCRGIQVGSTNVPPFNVGPGEIAKVIFPTEHAEDMDRVASAFCAGNDELVQTTGPVVALELPMPRSPLREVFHRQTAAEWLIARCGMSRQDAAEGLHEVEVDPEARICALAGNPRWLIAFVAAMHDSPSAVVFSTTGCDPLGIQESLATAVEQLRDAAGVFLTCFPKVGVAEPEYAATLNVTVGDRAIVA